MAITHRLDDAYIEKAWKRAETDEIENLAVELVEKSQETQNVEMELSRLLYLAFRCGFKAAIG